MSDSTSTRGIRLMLCIGLAVSLARGGAPPEIAYIQDGALCLATLAGDPVHVTKPRAPIGDFTVSPDASQVIFIPRDASRDGGPLYLLDVKSNIVRKLSRGIYWTPPPDSSHREVYADPEFSPDGAAVVFAIRDVPRSGDVDMVEASGPLAVMDVRSRRVRLLQATLNVDGQGPAFANTPHWSPDGTQILVSFETGFAIVSADGKTLKDVTPPQLPDNNDWSLGLRWFGNQSIVFGAGRNGVIGRIEVLQLSSASNEEAVHLSWLVPPAIENLQVSGSLVLTGTKTQSQPFDLKTHKLLRQFPPGAKLLRSRSTR